MSRVLAVIPARYGASRFPGKPLAPLWGRPLLQHVWERARRIRGVDDLVVATDDDRIGDAARAWGARVEMTPAGCASGTDRVAEVSRARPDMDIVLNLQGDEPELDAEAVSTMVAAMRAAPGLRMTTLAHPEHDASIMTHSDIVKVVVDAEGFADYFTRRVPVSVPAGGTTLRHVGVYGFRRDLLLEFAAWGPGRREQEERLEQLRALERGVRIQVIIASRAFSGVDTPEQLAALEQRGPRP